MLNTRGAQGARAFEIYNCFPSTISSSILTIMRRNGLIAKAGEKTTTPWIITVKGQEVLATLTPYTPHTYWKSLMGSDLAHNQRRMREEPKWYGKHATVDQYGWDQPDFLNRKQRNYGSNSLRFGC